MKDYKIIIKSADVAERLIGKYEELIGAIDCLNFDWCNEPFEVVVSMPTEENRGCSKLGLLGLVVMCSNDLGYFGFDLV